MFPFSLKQLTTLSNSPLMLLTGNLWGESLLLIRGLLPKSGKSCNFLFCSSMMQWYKETPCQCRSRKRRRLDPRIRKIPWRWKWQPTPVFLPGKSHGQRNLAGYRPWGPKSRTQLRKTCICYRKFESFLIHNNFSNKVSYFNKCDFKILYNEMFNIWNISITQWTNIFQTLHAQSQRKGPAKI